MLVRSYFPAYEYKFMNIQNIEYERNSKKNMYNFNFLKIASNTNS